MEQLGWTLIHFLWQGALIAAACALGFAILRSPGGRYAAGVGGIAAMAASPLITWFVLGGSVTGGSRFEVPQGLAAASSPALAGALSPPVNWVATLPLVWACGASLLAFRVLLGWRLERRALAGASPVGGEWLDRISLVALASGVTCRWRAALSNSVNVPQVSGVLRPVLLLPASALTQIPPEQLEAILAHEFAHIRRHDYLVNLLQTVIECLLFYHPAVWWLSRRVRDERELCCDAAAVEYCGDLVSYARALLALEEARPALSMAATGGGALRGRIASLLGYRRTPSLAIPALAVLFVSAGVVWAVQSAPPPPPPPPAAPAPPVPGELEALSRTELREKARTQLLAEMDRARVQMEKLAIARGAMQVAREAMQLHRPRTEPDAPYRKWANEDVAYLISEQERIVFLSLGSDTEREKFIEQFWQRRDPTPGTPANECKEEHYRRIAYANSRFASSIPGWRTDRGRAYISLGPPDEIESHPSKQLELWRYAKTRSLRFEGPDLRITSPALSATPPRAPLPPPPPPAPKQD
jgi:GWxTD domain-containing protein